MGKKKDKKRKREEEEKNSNKKPKNDEIDVYSQIFGENVKKKKKLKTS